MSCMFFLHLKCILAIPQTIVFSCSVDVMPAAANWLLNSFLMVTCNLSDPMTINMCTLHPHLNPAKDGTDQTSPFNQLITS